MWSSLKKNAWRAIITSILQVWKMRLSEVSLSLNFHLREVRLTLLVSGKAKFSDQVYLTLKIMILTQMQDRPHFQSFLANSIMWEIEIRGSELWERWINCFHYLIKNWFNAEPSPNQMTNFVQNTTIQNLWHATKAVLRGKFIVIQAFLKKRRKISNQQLNLLSERIRKRRTKPKVSRRREIIKIREESIK